MSDATDNLLSGISDKLTKEIELFLLNNISEKEKQEKIVEFINQAFKDGSINAFDFINQSKQEFKDQAEEFQKDFVKKLFDGQDNSVSK
jgi:intein-encoded DNA endonuclease-like protein